MKLKIRLLGCFLSLSTTLSGIDPDVVILTATTIDSGTIYSGNNRTFSDIVCTVRNGLVFEGDGRFSSPFNALYTIEYGNP